MSQTRAPLTPRELGALRARVCPAGVVALEGPVATGFVFAVGSVTVDGVRRNADELDLVLEACHARGIDPAAYLAPYARHVVAARVPAPARLAGETVTAFLAEAAR